MDYREELTSLRKKMERKQHLRTVIKILQEKYSELAVKLARFKKKKKLATEYEKIMIEYETVKAELKEKEDELISLKNCEKEYEEAFKKAVLMVKKDGGINIIKIEELELQMKRFDKRKKEIVKIYNEGYCAFDLGRDAVRSLEKAKKWGIADILGGGIIAAKGKFDYVYEAEGYLVEFKLQLSRFNDAFLKTHIADKEFRIDLNGQIMEGLLIDHIGNCMSDMPIELGNDLYTQKMILDTRNKVVTICGELKEILSELKIVVENTKMSYNETRNELIDLLIDTK